MITVQGCWGLHRARVGCHWLTWWSLQGVREVEEWMSQSSGIPLEELRPHMFLLRDRDATSHLMRHVPAHHRNAQPCLEASLCRFDSALVSR